MARPLQYERPRKLEPARMELAEAIAWVLVMGLALYFVIAFWD